MKENPSIVLTEIEYWSEVQQQLSQSISDDNPVYIWLNNHFDFSKINNCIEIGCYPGRFLTIFGEKGIIINGIDYLPEVKNLHSFFSQKKYNPGTFHNEDFLTYESQEKYDCVCSFGFIEHFTNWVEILTKHVKMINNNGYLIIEVPNFRGLFQRIPRYLFDYNNYKRHNLTVMKLSNLISFCDANNLEIIDARYFGKYQLWFEKNYSNIFIRFLKKFFIISFKNLIKILYKNDHHSFSCCVGIIARKSSSCQ